MRFYRDRRTWNRQQVLVVGHAKFQANCGVGVVRWVLLSKSLACLGGIGVDHGRERSAVGHLRLATAGLRLLQFGNCLLAGRVGQAFTGFEPCQWNAQNRFEPNHSVCCCVIGNVDRFLFADQRGSLDDGAMVP